MNYADIKYPDVANGEGVRVSLFVCGCRNYCQGCFNKELWDFNYGKPFTRETEHEIIKLLANPHVAGLSVLGGDPMEPENRKALLPFLQSVKIAYPNKTIWMWTGYEYETLWNTPILDYVDVLVDGKFIQEKASPKLKFKGSSNQRILNLHHKCESCHWFRARYCYNWLEVQEGWKVKSCWTDKDIGARVMEVMEQRRDFIEGFKELRREQTEMINWYRDKEKNKVRGFEKVSNAPEDTVLPTRKTKGSAGYDFYLPCDVVIPPRGTSEIILSGVKAYMPQNEVLLLHIRSSVGLLKRVTLANCTGVIDSDFYNNPDNEGNIGFVLQNNSDKEQSFKKGDRIAQGMFVGYGVVDDDNTTGERKGGTGSTGK